MAKKVKRNAGSWTYILVADRALPVEQQSRFTLNPLTGAERERFVDELRAHEFTIDGKVRVISRQRSVAREVALTHIVSIDRFPPEAPEAWPEKRDLREKYLETMSDDDVFEIGNAIYDRSSLGEEDAKQVGESSAPALTSS